MSPALVRPAFVALSPQIFYFEIETMGWTTFEKQTGFDGIDVWEMCPAVLLSFPLNLNWDLRRKTEVQ
jgi:hypothetical protein